MGLLPSAAARPRPARKQAVRHGSSAARRPAVERIACWSARHRKTAVAAWLALMAAAFIGGQFVTSPAV